MGAVATLLSPAAVGARVVTLPVVLRQPQNMRELNFVRSSWTKSALKARPIRIARSEWQPDGGVRPVAYEQMDAGAFVAGHARHVDRVLLRAQVIVADPTASPGTLAGWICLEPGAGLLHYLYVGQTFRRLGVAKLLIGDLATKRMAFTTWTPVLEKLRVPEHWTWDETRRWS